MGRTSWIDFDLILRYHSDRRKDRKEQSGSLKSWHSGGGEIPSNPLRNLGNREIVSIGSRNYIRKEVHQGLKRWGEGTQY